MNDNPTEDFLEDVDEFNDAISSEDECAGEYVNLKEEDYFTDDDFSQFWNEIDILNEDDPIDSEDEAKVGGVESRDIEYTKLVHAYCEYYSLKSNTNIGLRKKYFWFSFWLLTVLIAGCIGISVIICIFVKDMIAILASILAAIAGIVSSILVLPRIIGEYLFPHNEDDAIKELIFHFKKSDDERLNKK